MDKRKIFLTVLALILIAGFFLRLFPLRSGYHYWDETVYLQHAEILTDQSPNNYNEFDFRPPLFSLIIAGVFLVNFSLVSAHLAVAGLSSLAIILVYILGKELYSRDTAGIAAAIYATSPLGIMLSHDILVDPVLPIFWISTALLLTKALKTDEQIYYFSTGIAAALAVLMKFTSLVILPAIALIILISHFKEQINWSNILKQAKDFVFSQNNWLIVTGFFVGFAPYLIWSYLQFGSPLHVFLTAWTKSGATDAFLTYLQGWNLYILAPLYVGAPIFLWRFKMKKENYIPVIFFLALYLTLQFGVGNKEHRFLMPVVPFLALIAAEGLRELRAGEILTNAKLSKSVFVFLIFSSALILPTSMPERNVFAQGLETEWQAPVMEAGEWINQNTKEDAVVYTNYQYPALGYYSKREIIWFREYIPLNETIGEEIEDPGYIYYSEGSPYPNPSLEELKTDSRFQLNKTFENNVYIFYFTGFQK